jgi:urease accessory protein
MRARRASCTPEPPGKRHRTGTESKKGGRVAGERRPEHATRCSAAPLSARSLLELVWLASPALPVGGFSYSEGLEAAIESGLVGQEADASAWLLGHLHLVLARSELPAAAQAFGAWQRGDVASVAALNDWVRTTRESSEMRQQAEQMGRSLAGWLAQRRPEDPRVAALAALAPSPTWPVAFALAALHSGAPRREALLAFAFGWAENMVQAAVKAMPLGQSAGQRILGALAGDIPAAVDRAIGLMESERQAYAPMLAILSSQHETQYSRLFRS